MTRKTLLWLSAIAMLAVLVAYQVVTTSAGDRAREFAARADVPTVVPGADVLSGIMLTPARIHRYDYRRAAFGDAWTDDTDAPGGHNDCDTRDDILNRDLVDKTYVSIKRCPNAVETGTLHDPYTNATITFHRGAGIGASVEIDHIVPLALAWDMGAYDWPISERVRFANDPANLLAVSGKANEDKGDAQPALWMPPN
ncbi:MAG TPA: HNH endonuclease family protein, partial [Mycobacterium sp.]